MLAFLVSPTNKVSCSNIGNIGIIQNIYLSKIALYLPITHFTVTVCLSGRGVGGLRNEENKPMECVMCLIPRAHCLEY